MSRRFADGHVDPPGLPVVGKVLCSLTPVEGNRFLMDTACYPHPVRTRPLAIRADHPLRELLKVSAEPN